MDNSEAKKDDNQKSSKKSFLKIAVGVAIAVIIAIGVGALVKNAADISRLNSQLQESNEKYSEQVKENEELKAILDSDDKDAYMEQKAREEDFIKDDEINFYDVGSNQ